MKNVLIFGATSAIAQETARLYAMEGAGLYLVGRNGSALKTVAEDLCVRGASRVDYCITDLGEYSEHKTVIQKAASFLGKIDITLIAHGILGNQTEEEKDFDSALHSLSINCLSVISLLTQLAAIYQEQKAGTIAVISSVSGDRGRQSNYVYGTAKAAITVFLQGLRNRMQSYGVHVLTIKPGFVDTPMTSGFKKGMLWVGPDKIALGIYAAIGKKKDTVYLPWYWRWIMLIIRSIPEFIFKRLKL